MRSWIDVKTLLCAACIVGATACSDDGDGSSNDAGRGGSSGATAGTSGSGGRAGNGGSAGASGGSAGTGGATGGTGGATGGTGGAAAGTGGVAAGDAGIGDPDAGPDGEEDPGDVADSGAPPDEVAVTFDDAFAVLRDNCSGCHANGGPPQFAQADQDAAYDVTQADGNGGQPIYERIIVRAVDLRTMPPACGGGALGTGACLSVDDAAVLQQWVDDGALP